MSQYKWLVICLLLLLAVPSVLAQLNTADIVGTVTDPSGAVVVGAKVTATNVATGISRSMETSKSGEYAFTLMQVGTYEVSVEAKGFRPYRAKDLKLSAGDRARVDAKIEVGPTSETISVSAESAAALQTDSSTVGSVVPETSVQNAPLNGRNLISLVQMAPGVTTNAGESSVNGTTRGGIDDSRQTSSYVVNAQPDVTNNNMIDGMDNNDRRLGVIEVKPSIDAIQEVKVSTNLYSAEVGRTGGGVVEVVTKSGTNAFHGSAYEYIRNDAFDAKDYFWQPLLGKPTLHQNQFGASFGGPIKKNKTFFFTDFEIFRRNATTMLNSAVPDLVQVNTGDGLAWAHLKDLLATNAPFTLHEDYSPAGAPPGPPSAHSDVTVNPSTLVRNLLSLYPAPTNADGSYCQANSTNNYCINQLNTQHAFTYDGRIDQHFNDKNTLFGRVSYNQTTTTHAPPFPGASVNGTKITPGGINVHQPQLGLALNYTHVYRPNLLLELKAGYTYSSNMYSPSEPAGVANKIGFQCDSVFCVNSPSLPATNAGLPSIQLTYGTTMLAGLGEGGFVPLLVKNHTFQYGGALTWIRGNHTLKFGVGLLRRQLMGAQSFGMYGSIGANGEVYNPENCTLPEDPLCGYGYDATTYQYDYNSPKISMGPLTAFLTGATDSKSRVALAVTPHYRMWEPSGYVQDNWRASKKLTLNLGLRYDIFPPYSEINGYVSNFDPKVGMIVSPGLLGAQHSSKTANVPTSLTQFAPRLGFAYSVGESMVLRGGFGMTYSPNSAGGPNSSLTNAPYVYSATCGVSGGGPGKNGAPGNFHATGPCADTEGIDYAALAAGVKAPSAMLDMATNPMNYAFETINSISTSLRPSALYQFSLMLEKEWRANVMSVGYVGSQGRHLTSWININQPVSYAAPYPYPQFTETSAGAAVPDALGGTPGVIAPALMDIVSGATSNYNALQATFTRRAAKGLTATVNYTWAHALANASLMTEGFGLDPACSLGCLVDSGDKSITDPAARIAKAHMENGYQTYDRGNSGLDTRHRVAAIVNYELPFARSAHGALGAVAKGWMANLMATIQSGMPFTMVNDTGGPGGGFPVTGLINYNGNARPNQSCSGKSSHPTVNAWIDLSCFALQATGTFGNERSNQLYGPGSHVFNPSLSKEFLLTEKYRLQFRAEAYNIDNHRVLGQPGMRIGGTNYSAFPNSSPFDPPRCAVVTDPDGPAPPPGVSSCMDFVPLLGSVSRIPTGGPPANYPGAILNTSGINRQLQFALKLVF